MITVSYIQTSSWWCKQEYIVIKLSALIPCKCVHWKDAASLKRSSNIRATVKSAPTVEHAKYTVQSPFLAFCNVFTLSYSFWWGLCHYCWLLSIHSLLLMAMLPEDDYSPVFFTSFIFYLCQNCPSGSYFRCYHILNQCNKRQMVGKWCSLIKHTYISQKGFHSFNHIL